MTCSRVAVFSHPLHWSHGFVVHWEERGMTGYSLTSCESHLKTALKIGRHGILRVMTKKIGVLDLGKDEQDAFVY